MLLLIADDDPGVRDSLSRTLRFEGYEVEFAGDGAQALERVRTLRPDGAILDVAMPGMDGVEACRRLRAEGNSIPVLMLTARGRIGDRVAGLDAGADDYLAKPFALQELLARIRALLRRTAPPEAPADTEAAALAFGDLTLNPVTREVRRGARPVRLTRTEFAILEVFLRHPRQVLTRPVLGDQVWEADLPAGSNGLDVFVKNLRKKLEEHGETRVLHTVRGVGYVLRDGAV
ncbi:response regulator transcription factor [Amycolatopsis sp. GM8]|uniref:response regulator transcription factor n=1 Tax=Amycolatopsis sp. GM8 TaxID=2896530 RepID=UPI001F30D6B5|nr:response regulator transcription factor [Amycolatopsis sp. GM8]